MSGSKLPMPDWKPTPSACQCTPQRAWYQRGTCIFALVTYVVALLWITLILDGTLTPWAWVSVVAALLAAMTAAYGGGQ